MTAAELQQISVELSVNLGDEVSLYTVDGEQFTAAARKNAINEARGKVYDAKLAQFFEVMKSARAGMREFAVAYPEFFKEAEQLSVTSAGIASRPADCKAVLEVLSGDDRTLPRRHTPIPPTNIFDALNNANSDWAPAEDDPKFYEITNESGAGEVRMYPTSLFGANNHVDLHYLSYPVAVELTSAVPDPIMWKNDIMVIAEQILLKRQQIIT